MVVEICMVVIRVTGSSVETVMVVQWGWALGPRVLALMVLRICMVVIRVTGSF